MLELVKIEEGKKLLDSEKENADKMLEFARSAKINTPTEYRMALDNIALIRAIRDSIEEKKERVSSYAKDYLKKISSIANEMLDPLDKAEEIFFSKMQEFERMREDMITQADAFGLEIDPSWRKIPTESERTECYVRISHRFAIQDKNSVPMEYLMLDEKKLKEAVKNGIRVIPGIEIIEETKTIIRRK